MTHQAKQTADDWCKLRGQADWQDTNPSLFPGLRPAQINISVQNLGNPTAVESALATFKAESGWVERQSRTAFFEDGKLPQPEGEFDAITNAELAGQGESLCVRLVAGGWRLTTFSETEREDGEWLMHDTAISGIDRLPSTAATFGHSLQYRVYWQYDPEQGWRQFAARLLGFGEEIK